MLMAKLSNKFGHHIMFKHRSCLSLSKISTIVICLPLFCDTPMYFPVTRAYCHAIAWYRGRIAWVVGGLEHQFYFSIGVSRPSDELGRNFIIPPDEVILFNTWVHLNFNILWTWVDLFIPWLRQDDVIPSPKQRTRQKKSSSPTDEVIVCDV